MFGRQTKQDRAELCQALRFELCQYGVQPGLFVPYWRFLLQAEKVKRLALGSLGSAPECLSLLIETREQAWRELVEKYVRDGLDRKVLLALLYNVLTVKLDSENRASPHEVTKRPPAPQSETCKPASVPDNPRPR